MRRPLAAALTTLFLLAGCSTNLDGSATPGPAAAPMPAPGGSVATQPGAASGAPEGGGTGDGDARLSGNTEAICTQAVKTGADFARTFAANLELQIDAASADDPAAVQQAEQKAARDVQNYSYALNDLSKLAADPAVKTALADMSRQVTALKGDLRKLDGAKLNSLRSTLDEACGTA
jgi:hypothetical protein